MSNGKIFSSDDSKPALQPRGTSPSSIAKKVALVFSGGAAKGDFEVGVARYLFLRAKIKPAIICGNSVGAINATKLAEGEDPNNPAQGLAGLTAIWQGMNVNSDMWEEEDLLSKLVDDAKALAISAGATAFAFGSLGPLGLLGGLAVKSSIGDLGEDLKNLLKARSMANLNPLSKLIRKPGSLAEDKVRSSGIQLYLSVVALGDGQLRFVNEKGKVFERDFTPTPKPVPDPECVDPLNGEIRNAQAQLDSLDGKPIPIAKKDELARNLRKQIEGLKLAILNCPKVPSQDQLQVPLSDAIIASCSLPFIFPPVKLGEDWYVDGGVRTVLPVEAAVQAGADLIYAVVAGQISVDQGKSVVGGGAPLKDFAPGDANLLDIGMRVSADLMPDENTHRDLHPPKGWGVPVVVIRPGGEDIHNGMTIDPGLIDIRMDQGFMRADDTLQAYEKDPQHYKTLARRYGEQRQTGAIVSLRYKIWKREFAANGWILNYDAGGTLHSPAPIGFPPQPDDNALKEVREWKRELKGLVDERQAQSGAIPLDVENWWMKFERHYWPPLGVGSQVALWDYNHPFAPLLNMDLKVIPSKIPLNQPVQFTVTATHNGSAVNDANVIVDKQLLGRTGQQIRYTFKAKRVTTFDPDTHTRETEMIMPTGIVTKEGYRNENIPLVFLEMTKTALPK